MLQRKKSRFLMTITLALLIVFTILFVVSKTHLRSLAHAISATPTPAPTPTPVSHYGYSMRLFRGTKGQSLPYYLYVPVHYNPQQKYPLVLLLHGGGERGKVNNTAEQNMQILLPTLALCTTKSVEQKLARKQHGGGSHPSLLLYCQQHISILYYVPILL